MKQNWFDTFFDGLANELWQTVATSQMTDPEVGFLWEELQLASGTRVLDVPCGHGRHAAALAAKGCRLTAVDLSPDNLSIARSLAADVNWIQGDMRTAPWGGPFEAAYCWGNSFGYFPHQDCAAFLARVAASLQPGGRFVMETGLVAELLIPALKEESDLAVGPIRMHRRFAYDLPSSRLCVTYTFEKDGRQEVKPVEYHLHTAAELQRLLSRAGFGDVRLYADLERTEPGLGSQRLILRGSV